MTILNEKNTNAKAILIDIANYVTEHQYYEDKISELSNLFWKEKKENVYYHGALEGSGSSQTGASRIAQLGGSQGNRSRRDFGIYGSAQWAC